MLGRVSNGRFGLVGCDRSAPATSFVVAVLLLAACLPPARCGTRGAGGSAWSSQSEVTQPTDLRRSVRHCDARSSPLTAERDLCRVTLEYLLAHPGRGVPN